LLGELGSGKTSVLNLLRSHLFNKAIVVSFSTWLPGSPEALCTYLLTDIAKECSKHYLVPGLRKDARRVARALARNIPVLGGLSDLLSTVTQKEEIDSLAEAISRLPKRVVVLLDEVDRMQKGEILALLKIVRGVSASPNLSFVYAFDRSTVERAVLEDTDPKSRTYFEKFFPVSVRVPTPEPAVLRAIGLRRLRMAFRRNRWSGIESDETDFLKEIEKIWNDLIAPFCHTIRSVGLLGNNVGVAAINLRGEVNPVDLTLIELLRQSEPSVYEMVWRYRDILAGEGSWLSPSYVARSDAEKTRRKKQLMEELRLAVVDVERYEAIRKVLDYMFPLYAQIDGGSLRSLRRRRPSVTDEDRNIADPSSIVAYFLYKLPGELFSLHEMSAFLTRFRESGDVQAQLRVFLETFQGMEKGDPRRADFLSKLSDRINTIDPKEATAIAHTCMYAAHAYSSDNIFVGFGEAGHVVRIVIRVALRTPLPHRPELLSGFIVEATDDTMALRIQITLSRPGTDFDLGVSFKELYPAFLKRMRNRYGRDVDIADVNLEFSDPKAFNLWGASDLTKEGITIDPEDRAIQRDFWLRYIGKSRSRLAQAFGGSFMPETYSYQSDPTAFVESKIPISDLRRLYEQLPTDAPIAESDEKSLRRLADLLDGKFKHGIPPFAADPGNPTDTEDEAFA